jgi:capping protein beta
MADLVDSMLDLMRRLPPTRTEENVTALVGICPEYADDLLGSVDQPLKLKTDRATGREYLICDYNRDGESYRRVGFVVNATSGSSRLKDVGPFAQITVVE